MAWDGSGAFSRTNGTQTGATTWADSRDAGNNITASQHDTHDEDLADGIQACLTKNNESKPTADFRPNADASYDLGSTSLRWVNLYLSGSLQDANDNELLKFSTTASAVNEFTLANAATGSGPTLSATGGDTNIDIVLSPKGSGGVRNSGASVIQNSKSEDYTLVAADANKHILHPTADDNARTFTIPANASVAFAIGTCVVFVNEINTLTIAITSDTLTLQGAGTTGSRTLAANGMATILKTGATSWKITGTGLS